MITYAENLRHALGDITNGEEKALVVYVGGNRYRIQEMREEADCVLLIAGSPTASVSEKQVDTDTTRTPEQLRVCNALRERDGLPPLVPARLDADRTAKPLTENVGVFPAGKKNFYDNAEALIHRDITPEKRSSEGKVPEACNIRMSHYGTCKLGTKGCSSKHYEQRSNDATASHVHTLRLVAHDDAWYECSCGARFEDAQGREQRVDKATSADPSPDVVEQIIEAVKAKCWSSSFTESPYVLRDQVVDAIRSFGKLPTPAEPNAPTDGNIAWCLRRADLPGLHPEARDAIKHLVNHLEAARVLVHEYPQWKASKGERATDYAMGVHIVRHDRFDGDTVILGAFWTNEAATAFVQALPKETFWTGVYIHTVSVLGKRTDSPTSTPVDNAE